MIQKIKVESAVNYPNAQLIDARTPKEYEEDHIIGAINVPLLSNEERHEIGIIYKKISRDKAIEKGLEYYGPKVPTIVKTMLPYKDKTIIVYCARGGMRSGIIASLLDSLGFKVLQIEGGYKAFRNYLLPKLNNFKLKPKVYVLWGLTCSGKTELLKNLPNFIDLEGLAQHRGSLYGAINLKPSSQKKFENLLLSKLEILNDTKYIFLEGESRKIGDCQMPDFLYKSLVNGNHILVERTMNERIKAMVEEYFTDDNAVNEIKEITKRLWKVISNKKKEELLRCLDEKEYFKAGKIFLEDYYDPLYSNTLKKRKYLFIIKNDNLEKAKERVLAEISKI